MTGQFAARQRRAEAMGEDMASPASVIRDAAGRGSVRVLPYQLRILESPSRFTWNCWARQTGKSFALTLRRVMRGVRRQRTQLILSAGMRQTQELMRKVREHCHALRIDAGGVEKMQAGGGQIRLPNGVRLIGLPANPETVRGFSGDVLLDEFAMHRDDRAIWAAIFPTILRGDGELDIASTPKGKDNLFYSLQHNETFERTTIPLPEAIAQGLQIDQAAVRKAMGDDELYRQEFLCEFLDESEAFLPYRVIAACEDAGVEMHPDWVRLPRETVDLYAGIDVARKRDLTVIWLWRMEAAPAEMAGAGLQNWSLRCAGLIEMSNAPFPEQQEMIRRVLALRCVRRCAIDATGMGLPVAEWAQGQFGRSRVEAVTFTAGIKAQMAGQMRRLAEEGRLRIPADETIRLDWHSLRRSVSASGGMRLDAARSEGGHADRFWAAALGAYAAESGAGGPVEYCSQGSLRFARVGTW